jgi:hypothetical protein
MMTDNQKAIQIRAVKLKRKGDEGHIPEITVHDAEMKLDKTYANCENLCHSDFTKAVKRLNHHIAVLTDKITTDEFEDSEEIDEIIVARGYSLSGAEDELRITLKGYQKTKRGGTFQINTPVLYLEQDDDDDNCYLLLDDLKEKIKRIEMEARLYIFEGKRFEDPQLSLNLPDSDEKVTKAVIAPHVDLDPSMNSPEAVAAAFVAEANKGKDGKPKKTRVPQSPKHKSGVIEE